MLVSKEPGARSQNPGARRSWAIQTLELSSFSVGGSIRGGASPGACLACEAVVSKAKDRADSPLCRALGRDEAQVLI
jgi:hypothetical protein